ncbi:hypothetical protein ABE320_17130 [Bacillus velezensis]|uniref:hypothetical protein n=1 Tax=Bacillus velezensis TaxID=492670 RepID=UPI0030CB7C94
MRNEYDWIDKNYNTYTVDQISDQYLKNILRFLCNGGGYHSYLDEGKITRLFTEATSRKIKHSFKLEDAIQAYRDEELFEHLRYLEYLSDKE